MAGRRALASTWRALVAGLAVAGWAEKGVYYDVTVSADGSAAVPTAALTPTRQQPSR